MPSLRAVDMLETGELPEGYALILEQRDGYLFAHVTGPRDTFGVSIAYWSAIAAECRRLGTQRLLVLEELAERATRYDMYEMVRALVEMGFRDIRIAYVDPTEDPMLLRYAEHMAADVGLTAQAFMSMEPAVSWLLARQEAIGTTARGGV